MPVRRSAISRSRRPNPSRKTWQPKHEWTRPNTAVLYCATVRTPIAPMHGEPGIASQMISQQLAGHRVDIVDEEGDWVRARGADGYEGWMHLGFLLACAEAQCRVRVASRRVCRSAASRRTASGGPPATCRCARCFAPDETVESGEVDRGDVDLAAALSAARRRRSFASAQESVHARRAISGAA